MKELIESLHKKAGTKCDQYINGNHTSGQWIRDMGFRKCYVIDGLLFGRPYTMNIYPPNGCYPARKPQLDDEE